MLAAWCLLQLLVFGFGAIWLEARCFRGITIAMVGSACANLVVYMVDTIVFTYSDAYTKTMVA